MASKNSTKKQQIQQNKAAVAVSKASSVNIGASLSAISATSVKIQGDLAKISEELIQKHAELQAVDETIGLKKEELANLHGVDNALLTLDEAKALHTQFLEEAAKQRQQIDQEHMELGAQRQQERDREEEEYNYKLQQNRKTENDAWNEQLRVRQNQERDRKEAFEKDIVTRRAALEAQEAAYQAALQKAATFDAEVASAVSRAESILKNVLTKDFTHKQEIADIQHKTTIEKYQFDQQRMVQTANTLEQQNKELQAQLKASQEELAKLAKAAVDGAAKASAQSEALALMTNIGGTNGARPRS